MKEISNKLKVLRATTGLTQDEFAEFLGIKPSKVRDLEAGRLRVNEDVAALLLENLDVDLNLLFSNSKQSSSDLETWALKKIKGAEGVASKAQRLVEELSERSLVQRAQTATNEFWRSHTPDSSEYAFIPLHEAELAAGTGALNLRERIVDQLAFRIDWLQRIGIKPENARLARVRGDSMQPTLQDGDLAMIDTSKREVPLRKRNEGTPLRADLFALIDDGQARIKRIERSAPHMVILRSDNDRLYSPEPKTGAEIDDLNIIGKVMWWGHTVRE